MSEQTTSSLGRQPLEVINNIASYLSTADICALRLTCKAANHRLTDFFLRRFFRTKQFWIDEPSLQALIDMSAHPTISRELKHVALGSDHYHLCTSPLGTLAMSGAQIQQLRLRVASHQHLQRTGTSIAMLTKAFANLPNLETLSIRDFDNSIRSTALRKTTHTLWSDVEAFDSYGTKAASRATGHPIVTDWIKACTLNMSDDVNSIGDLFTTALVALAGAGARPSAIEVIIRDGRRWGLRDKAFYIPVYLQPSVKPMLYKLTKLHLDIALGREIPCAIHTTLYRLGPGPLNTSSLLQNFLCLTPRLTWLRLGFDGSDYWTTHQFLHWLGGGSRTKWSAAYSAVFTKPAKLARLEHFEMAGAEVTFEILQQLILRLSKTLRKLNLRGVTLRTTAHDQDHEVNTWSRFLIFLAHNTDLRSFGLWRAGVSGGDPSLHGGIKYKGNMHVHSTDNMKLYLEDLAQEVQDQWDSTPGQFLSDTDTSEDEHGGESDDEDEMEVDDGEDGFEDDGDDDTDDDTGHINV
ncbi:hypothetical protein CONLIGDRAFT_702603 [Coniochaeta ligniaria NRRL 30616]|uniref:F-box domain-containing protein n=1 Tax=Coniochaeta ligniaria NRRL 30616 TaxID=1408157 RepID=A0A1J7IR29_9PEZI|nr:hypothetical protein CONLIGDRAFT_702603 [Coniochaeta ligniaria NRRL 30616]